MPQAAVLSAVTTPTAAPRAAAVGSAASDAGATGAATSDPAGTGFASLLHGMVATASGKAAAAPAPAAEAAPPTNDPAAQPGSQAAGSQTPAVAAAPAPDTLIAAMLDQAAATPAAQPAETGATPAPHAGATRARAGKDDAPTDAPDQTAVEAAAAALPVPLMPPPAPPAPQPAAAVPHPGAGGADAATNAVGDPASRRATVTADWVAADPGSGAADATDHGPSTPGAIHGHPAFADLLPSSVEAGSTPAGSTSIATMAAAPPLLPAKGEAVPAAASSASPALPAAPAAQVAPVLVSMTGSSDGPQHLIVQLTPELLGRVEIRIERAADGTASVQVSAERPETLQMLQHDAVALQHTLDQAGMPSEGRSLTFTLATPEIHATSETASGSWNGPGSGAGSGMGGNAQQGGGSGEPGQHGRFWSSTAARQNDVPDEATSKTPRAFAGINITA